LFTNLGAFIALMSLAIIIDAELVAWRTKKID
jgi:hypothetical protein